MDMLTAHQRAQDAFAGVLAEIHDDQLDDPTPCPDWAVRDLLHHVIGGNFRAAGLVPPEQETNLGGLVRSFETSARAAQAAFAAPGGLDRTIAMSIGTLPARVIISMRTTDVLTHAWDLAMATGQPTDIDEELAGQALDVGRKALGPEFRGPGRPFGEEQPCDPSRPAADQLAAFLGRTV